VHLVDEQDDLALGLGHLGQYALEPFLEFAAVLRPRDHRAEIECHHTLGLERLRHVALDDAQREALDDRRLAHAGFADQHRIVLGAPRQHLDRPADFLVAPDHGVELALPRHLGDVARVLLQRVEGLLRILAVDRAALPQVGDGLFQPLRVGPGIAEGTARIALAGSQRDQQPILRDILVASACRLLLRAIQHPHDVRGELRLPCAAARYLGQLRQHRLHGQLDAHRVAPGGADQAAGGALGIIEQRLG